MLVLWTMSCLASIIVLYLAIIKRSSLYMLIGTLTSLPFALYFLGAENAWKYVGFTPILLFLVATYFWFFEKKYHAK